MQHRENQIEEMARDLENHTCMSQFQAEIASTTLYAKGYRKASDVAREIFEEIERVVGCALCVDLTDWLAYTELKKKYTKGE